MYIEGSDGTIKIDMADGNTKLQSVTKVAYDGETPMCVIVTYNNKSPDGQYLKLFIDGILEDTSTFTQTVTTNNDTTIGWTDGILGAENQIYQGIIEEIILYNKCYDIPETAGEYVWKANNIDSTYGDAKDKIVNADTSLTHSAKLFVYDYTNIRGTTVQQVGSSKQTGWKVTSV
jgi:hypothetical protein